MFDRKKSVDHIELRHLNLDDEQDIINEKVNRV